MLRSQWLLLSTISTLLGIVAGACYLLFSEHSIVFSQSALVLSEFWSTFLLWAFVLLFVSALMFNLLAFIEMDSGTRWRVLSNRLQGEQGRLEQQEFFFTRLKQQMQQQGKLLPVLDDGSEVFFWQHSVGKTLVYFYPDADNMVTIECLRDQFQQMLSYDCAQGMLISFQGFTSQARIFAREANIELIEYQPDTQQQVRRLSTLAQPEGRTGLLQL
ncbi:restriction endonuclease [Alkalimonas delamerensis]|uniref:Restriction endonuclease n=1 Tax=Alkalimonas delamerensis TaxID=265981 RepID=A0ABT9GKV8_9GAMM|nr:restriction endonuclease [Alkalimonas delamerensis]MDP4527599.1 restriction endonuclease [Alkalimonas delamerensis]